MALISLLVAVGSFLVALSALAFSVRFSRAQLRISSRQHERDFGATVVVELNKVHRTVDDYVYDLRVTNVGPAVARDVSVDLVEWSDERGDLGLTIDRDDVAPILQRGEQRDALLRLPVEQARFDDISVALEIGADYYDDNGVRNERLALVFEDQIVLLPVRPDR